MKTTNPRSGASNGNREAWLQKAGEKFIGPLFAAKADAKVPEVRVSCGFPSRSATSSKRRRIGECWSPKSAADERAQIFISPVLEDAITVLATLIHEYVHAVDRNEHGHKGPFKRMALAVGLTGKMTATTAGPELAKEIEGWIKDLGPYPHAGLSTMTRTKQSTRLIKCECDGCGYTVRTTLKWIEAAGAPLCPACDGEQLKVMGA